MIVYSWYDTGRYLSVDARERLTVGSRSHDKHEDSLQRDKNDYNNNHPCGGPSSKFDSPSEDFATSITLVEIFWWL